MDIPTNPQLYLDPELEREREDDDENKSGGNGESEVQLEIRNSEAPTENNWKVVEGLVIFLYEFRLLTDQVSSSLYVTSNSTFFYIACSLDQLNKWLISDHVDFRLMATVMKFFFDKY